MRRRTNELSSGLLCRLVRPWFPEVSIRVCNLWVEHTLDFVFTRSLRSGILPPSLPILSRSSDNKATVQWMTPWNRKLGKPANAVKLIWDHKWRKYLITKKENNATTTVQLSRKHRTPHNRYSPFFGIIPPPQISLISPQILVPYFT